MKKYFVEFVGTFYLVLTVLFCVLLGTSNTHAAIAIGFILMVMVYAGGAISGGHYNPAVSLAAAIRGALPFKELFQYWASQTLGMLVAVGVFMKFMPTEVTPIAHFHHANVGIAEFLFTFALCYVVLMTATRDTTRGNQYYGLAIGSSVTAGIFAIGGVCFAALNPAIALALGMSCVAPFDMVGLTVLGNFLAGIAAALAFKFIGDED